MEAKTISPQGRILDKLITRAGLDVLDLSRLTGVPTSLIFDVLQGRSESLSPEHSAKIAKSTGLEDRHLLGFIPLPESIEVRRVVPQKALQPERLELVGIPALHARQSGNVVTVFPGEKKQYSSEMFHRKGINPDFVYHLVVDTDENLPRVGRGDEVLINAGDAVMHTNAFYVLWYQGKLRLHRITVMPDEIQVDPLNPAFPRFSLQPDRVQVLGRAFSMQGSAGLGAR